MQSGWLTRSHLKFCRDAALRRLAVFGTRWHCDLDNAKAVKQAKTLTTKSFDNPSYKGRVARAGRMRGLDLRERHWLVFKFSSLPLPAQHKWDSEQNPFLSASTAFPPTLPPFTFSSFCLQTTAISLVAAMAHAASVRSRHSVFTLLCPAYHFPLHSMQRQRTQWLPAVPSWTS